MKFEEDEQDNVPPVTYQCSLCSNTECIEDYSPDSKYLRLMQEKHICLNCAYIIDILENHKKPIFIINGFCYEYSPYITRPFNKIAGTNGKEFYIFELSTKKCFKTNDLKNKGAIPEALRNEYPDNAIFLTLPSYTKYHKNPFQCHSIGCWDRYRCIRYNLKLEEKNGPFNEIPSKYVIGSQKCPSFIDFYELKK